MALLRAVIIFQKATESSPCAYNRNLRVTTFGQSKIAYFASYDPPEFLTLVNTYCRQSITKCWIGDSVKKSSCRSLNVNNLSLSQ